MADRILGVFEIKVLGNLHIHVLCRVITSSKHVVQGRHPNQTILCVRFFKACTHLHIVSQLAFSKHARRKKSVDLADERHTAKLPNFPAIPYYVYTFSKYAHTCTLCPNILSLSQKGPHYKQLLTVCSSCRVSSCSFPQCSWRWRDFSSYLRSDQHRDVVTPPSLLPQAEGPSRYCTHTPSH